MTLTDGSYHTVNSSDMAFRQAGRLAMSEGMPKCNPVLLEPIMAVSIAVPSEANARINSIISQRRGQILGFDARPGWPGWDLIEAHIPEAEMDNLIVDLRSATAGVGSFTFAFDHLAEVIGQAPGSGARCEQGRGGVAAVPAEATRGAETSPPFSPRNVMAAKAAVHGNAQRARDRPARIGGRSPGGESVLLHRHSVQHEFVYIRDGQSTL